MDMLQSSNPRMKTLQENSIISFNAAFKVSHESLFHYTPQFFFVVRKYSNLKI